MLAPLAGIGNWFIRLQAKRHGAGMAVSEMVSSHAIHHHNERTLVEMLHIDPRERDPGAPAPGGPVAIQLFGADPAVMRSAAARVAAAGADAIDLNMGCPVPKVCKTGAGAALLSDPARAVAVARAAAEGSGLPVTAKLRCGQRPGERSGVALALRLAQDAGVAAIAFHPRSAAVHHRGVPDYALAAQLVQQLDVPVILTGGLHDRDAVLRAFHATGVTAVMLARGALGNPWLFRALLRGSGSGPGSGSGSGSGSGPGYGPGLGPGLDRPPTLEEVVGELDWTIARAVEHLGAERATRWLRKIYPWYVAHLRAERAARTQLQQALQRAPSLAHVHALLHGDPARRAIAA